MIVVHAASGVFVSAMILVLLLDGYLPSDIASLPVVGMYMRMIDRLLFNTAVKR